MNIALYARVSTNVLKEGTESKRQDPETQLRELREWVRRQGWEVKEEYTDEMSAAKTSKLTNRIRLMNDAYGGKVDVVVCWKLDRFARSMTDFVEQMNKLNSWGVRFISISQGIDTDRANPASKLLMHVLVAMAEFERSLISERVQAGMARAKAQGKQVGRAKAVFDILKAKEMIEGGFSYRKVAETLNVNLTTLHKRLKQHRVEAQ